MKKILENHIKESNKDSHFIPRMIAMAVFAAIFAYSFATLVLDVEKKSFNYQQSGVANYKVCLKENTYFTDECQPAGKQYIASLIKDVKTDFRYSFRADEKVDYQYNYDIVVRVTATDGDSTDKVLYESEDTLMTSQAVHKTGSEFAIDEAVDIDYGKYNRLITQFRSDYGLTLKANVAVTLNVHFSMRADGFHEQIQNSEAITLNIPLSERTINVSLESDEINTNDGIEERTRDFNKSLPWIIAADISATAFLSIMIISIVIFVFRESRRSDYDKEVSHILREYGQIIVEVDHLPRASSENAVEVGDFGELLNVHDTIEKPIIYKEVSEGHCSVFMIEDSETDYTYIVSLHKNAATKKRKSSR